MKNLTVRDGRIDSPQRLTQICTLASRWPTKDCFRMKMSQPMYRRLVNLQLKDTYPNLLAFRRGRATYLAKV